MKVICIDASDLKTPLLKEGETYTVYDVNDWFFTKPAYFLEEIDKDQKKKTPFSSERFIPLDGPDETTLVTEEFEEKYCETVK